MENKFGRFGSRLESARKAKHLTRAELSAKLGISESILRDLEIRGSTSRKTFEILPQLQEVLQVSLTWLLTGKTPARSEKILKHVEAVKNHADQIAAHIYHD